MTYSLLFNIILGSGDTSLTLNAQIVNTSGTPVGSAITTGFTEIGNGHYILNCTTIVDAQRGAIKFYVSGVPGTILATAPINPEEGEYTDAPVSTVDTVVDGIKSSTDNLPGDPASETNVNANETKIDALPTAANNADAVWDELSPDHVGAGKAGRQQWVDIDAILVDTGTDGVVLANDAITAAKIAANAIGSSELATDAIGTDQLSDAAVDKIIDEVIEGSITFRQLLRLFASTLLMKSSGGGGAGAKAFRDLGDTKDRVSATVDIDGNRGAPSLDGS